MTRPMPGPPEHRKDAHPHGDNGWCPLCHHLIALRTYGSDKNLTDAEVAAEYWRAGWIASLDFHDEHEADEASTWHRFATLPHALKETT